MTSRASLCVVFPFSVHKWTLYTPHATETTAQPAPTVHCSTGQHRTTGGTRDTWDGSYYHCIFVHTLQCSPELQYADCTVRTVVSVASGPLSLSFHSAYPPTPPLKYTEVLRALSWRLESRQRTFKLHALHPIGGHHSRLQWRQSVKWRHEITNGQGYWPYPTLFPLILQSLLTHESGRSLRWCPNHWIFR